MLNYILKTEDYHKKVDSNFLEGLYDNLNRIRESFPIEKCVKITPEAYGSKEYLEPVKEIEKLLENRFGISFRFKKKFISILEEDIDSLPYVTIITPGIKTNIEDYQSMKNDLERTLEELSVKYARKPGMLEEVIEQVNANETIDYILKTEGIKININDFKFLNVPNDVYVYINFNILYLFYRSDYPLTNKEIVALLFHEVGHIFSLFHCFYRTSLKNVSILKEIQKVSNKKNTKPKDILLIIVKQLKLKNVNIEDNSIMVATIKLYRELLTYYYPNSYYGRTFEEFNSDLFVKHFGLLKDLASGLDKLTSRYNMVNYYLPPGFRYRQIGIMKQIYLVFKIIFKLMLRTIQLAFEIPLMVIILIVSTYMALVYSEARLPEDRRQDIGRKDRIYDTPRRRYERIKLGLVEHLKRETDPIIKQELLRDIEIVDLIIRNNTDTYFGLNVLDYVSTLKEFDPKITLAGNVMSDFYILLQTFYNKRTREYIELENLEKRLEDFINNNLYIAKEQLLYIQSKK